MIELVTLLQCFRAFCIIMGTIVAVHSGCSVYNHAKQIIKNRAFNVNLLKCLGIFIFAATVAIGASGIIYFVPNVTDHHLSQTAVAVLLFVWAGFSLSLTCFFAHGSPRPDRAFWAYGLFILVTFLITVRM